YFFLQAEDGIRDKLVTGVQTCALPIYLSGKPIPDLTSLSALTTLTNLTIADESLTSADFLTNLAQLTSLSLYDNRIEDVSPIAEIGRASCRDSVEVPVGV